jgi:SOS response regulatory protein OraA/RecX
VARADPDIPAAERLIARHAAQLQRVSDPRRRRQRAYALLVRNGFDSEIASRLAARTGSASEEEQAEVDDPEASTGSP